MATPGNFIKTPGILLENSWNLNFKFGWPPCIYQMKHDKYFLPNEISSVAWFLGLNMYEKNV